MKRVAVKTCRGGYRGGDSSLSSIEAGPAMARHVCRTTSMRQLGRLFIIHTLIALWMALPAYGIEPPGTASSEETVSALGAFRVAGADASATLAPLDAIMQNYMAAKGARAAQLAVVDRTGRIIFSHAFTNSADPSYPTTLTSSVMRLASITKTITIAAARQLINAGKLDPATAAFPYLGITSPLLASQTPDSQINAITVQQLINSTSGLPGEGIGDPTGMMRQIEIAAHNTGPLSQDQYTHYLYGVRLASTPATTAAANNAGFYVLGRVIESASGQRFLDFVNGAMLTPLGIYDAIISQTAVTARPANEVRYDDPGSYLSVLDPTSSTPVPCPDGGALLYEVTDASSGIAISAESYARFLRHFYGNGARTIGAMCGTASYAETLGNGLAWIVIFNRNTETFSPDSTLVKDIDGVLASQLTASVAANRTTFAVGQVLGATATVVNPGRPETADFYAGMLRPDGTIEFATDMSGGTVLGNFADLSSYRPIATTVSLATPFSVTVPNFYTHRWTASDPHGSYVVFVAAAKSGAVTDGVLTNDEIFLLTTATVTFP
jgi:CubicO group peptidase (beta-lactamase class C family)